VVLGRRLAELLDCGLQLSGLPALESGLADSDQLGSTNGVEARRFTSPLKHVRDDWYAIRCWHGPEAMLRECNGHDNGVSFAAWLTKGGAVALVGDLPDGSALFRAIPPHYKCGVGLARVMRRWCGISLQPLHSLHVFHRARYRRPRDG
jgi:hypothetical protein